MPIEHHVLRYCATATCRDETNDKATTNLTRTRPRTFGHEADEKVIKPRREFKERIVEIEEREREPLGRRSRSQFLVGP